MSARLDREDEGLRLSIKTAAPPRSKMIYALYYFDRSGDEGGVVETRIDSDGARTIASDIAFSYSETLPNAAQIAGTTLTISIPEEVTEPIDEWTVAVATRGESVEIRDAVPQQTGDGGSFSSVPFR